MFVSFDEWCGLDIFYPDDSVYEDWKVPRWYEYYRSKWYYAELSKAESVLEIGVRFGYSAYSFMSSSFCKSYTGWDLQEPIDGGVDFSTFEWVREKVFSRFPSIKSTLVCRNSLIGGWGDEKYDLIHIDGDHGFSGALNDCRMAYDCLNIGGLMVVDDATFLPNVAKAVDAFLDEYDLIKVIAYSVRGDALIWKV